MTAKELLELIILWSSEGKIHWADRMDFIKLCGMVNEINLDGLIEELGPTITLEQKILTKVMRFEDVNNNETF